MPILEILYEEDSVHAFGNNSAESEPICMKSGTMWAKCGGWPWQILAAICAVATVWELSFLKNANVAHQISMSCAFRPSQLRNDYRSLEIHGQMVPLQDVWFPFLLLESIQSLSSWIVCCIQERYLPISLAIVNSHRGDILLSRDVIVNKPMWAWQRCHVASVNK